MKGATAEPWLKTIRTPKSAKTITIGNNQYFFRSAKNCINSLKKLNIKIASSLTQYFFPF